MNNDWPAGDLPALPASIPLDAIERTADAAALLQQIEELQNSGDYLWAGPALEGIHATVEKTGRATANQQTAVDHIEDGGRRSPARGAGW